MKNVIVFLLVLFSATSVNSQIIYHQFSDGYNVTTLRIGDYYYHDVNQRGGFTAGFEPYLNNIADIISYKILTDKKYNSVPEFRLNIPAKIEAPEIKTVDMKRDNMRTTLSDLDKIIHGKKPDKTSPKNSKRIKN